MYLLKRKRAWFYVVDILKEKKEKAENIGRYYRI